MSLRVVIVTRIPPVLAGFDAVVRAAGHEPVAFLTMRNTDGRYGPISQTDELVMGAAPELDVLLPARRSTIAPLLASVRPDLVVCMGFPWKIPPDALAVPRLGWLNGHPSLLPRHRGPLPVAWAIREGEDEIGITFHLMDAELDTGPILAQRGFPLGELEPPDIFYPRFGIVIGEVLAEALESLDAGEPGAAQPDDGTYESFFTEEDAWLDLSRPAAEVHRLAWAWLYAMSLGGTRGALLELDGVPVRVLATSLTEVEGARRLECGDASLWVVETEELSEEEASRTTAPAPSTR
jgi:methionyl-tRNA formyltransferase